MLQRIQTLYLIVALITAVILPFVFPLWNYNNKPYYFMFNQLYITLNGIVATLIVVSIISFKKRNNQFVLNRVSIIFNLILLGLFVYRSLNVSGETQAVFEKGIGMFLPIATIVFLAAANKAIKKDEDLVKSVDRLR